MYPSLKHLTLAMACIASIGATTAALATQPAPGTGATQRVPNGPGGIRNAGPGALKSLKGTDSVDLPMPTTFSFGGSGYCSLTLKGGDGYSKSFEGELPFTGTYTYSSTTMSSYDHSKSYQASVITSGNCTTVGPGPFTTSVTIVNPAVPAPQGPSTNTVSVANTAKLGLAGINVAASAPLPSASVPASGVRAMGK